MILAKLSERIAHIEAKVGDKASEILTGYELRFLNDLKRFKFGSDPQKEYLERIEKKVFGEQD